MPTSYTTLLGLALPVTGELAGVWGDVVSNYITQYLDSAVAGTQTISGTQTAVTLSVTNGSSLVTAGTGATGSAQFQIINCTGNPAGLLTITAPASSRQYIIINATSTSQSVKIVGTGPTTGVTLIAGEKAHVAWNGSDFVKIATTAAAGGSNTQVQYNSSGVLAGSSNLTFDGTNLTVGGTASATKLIPTGGAATGNGMYLPAANTLAWSNNGSETMRLDSSGNLGLGVTPSAWAAGFRALELPLGTGLWADGGTPSAWLTSNLYFDGSFRYKTSTQATGYNLSGGFHRWYNAPSGTAGTAITFTQAMTLDSSGNLGLGVTPSAWASGWRALQLANGSSFVNNGATNYTGIFQNAYYNGTNTLYLSSTYALKYELVNGTHAWYTAAVGTAGNAISFTQAMTLDSSGRLLLGTTTTTNNIRLDEKVAIVGVNVPYNGMALTGYTGAGSTSYRPLIDFNRSRGTTDGSMTVVANQDILGSVIFRGSDGTSFQDAAVISGEVDGTPGANDMPGRLTFWTTPDGSTTVTERARITSGGDLLVGTSSTLGAGYRGSFVGGGNVIGAQSTTSTNNVFAGLNSSGTVTFSVTGNGAVSKASGSFRIPHPLPAKENTHQLVHSFIEGPQADLIYRGKAALVNGRASVNIDQASGMTDGTFVVLCRDVQCFTSNETDWDAVRGTVVGNILTIECQNGLSTATVSWMVIGERQDKHMYDTDWTDDNGKVIVEPLIKPMVNV